MSVVLQLKEQLRLLKDRRMELSLSADASIKAAKEILALSSVTSLMEIDLQKASAHLANAVTDQGQMAAIIDQIRTLERELGHG
jgi:hypothetical protein